MNDAKVTLNMELETKTYSFDGDSIKLKIWDTVTYLYSQVGQEKYRSLATQYINGASLVIVVFDVKDHGSFEGMESWVESIGYKVSHEILLYIVGNKADDKKE